jgi:hypothetical protein
MLHKCANSACPILFRSLDRGKLFLLQIDNPAATDSEAASGVRQKRSMRRAVERFWLCDACSLSFTLIFERGRGMVTVPLPASNTRNRSPHLTPMQPAMSVRPAELKGIS